MIELNSWSDESFPCSLARSHLMKILHTYSFAHARPHTRAHTHTLSLSLTPVSKNRKAKHKHRGSERVIAFKIFSHSDSVGFCVFGGANRSGEEDDRLRSRAKRASRMQQRHWGIGHQSQPQKRQSRTSHRNYPWAHRHALRRWHLPNRYLFARSLISPFLAFSNSIFSN